MHRTKLCQSLFHHLDVSYSSFLSLQQSLKLKIWFSFVEEDHLSVDILSSWVIEVIDEVGDTDEGDVPAHNHKLLLRGLVAASVLLSVTK